MIDNIVSNNNYVIKLSEEILDDAELERGSAHSLVLKASRLARFCDDQEIYQWLIYERDGYIRNNAVSEKYMGFTKRWDDLESKTGYWGGVAEQEAAIESYSHQLEVAKAFKPSGEKNVTQLNTQIYKISEIGNSIIRRKRIVTKVRALVQDFAARTYKAKVFSAQASDIFSDYQIITDKIIQEKAQDMLKKIPHIFRRLSENDPESISHALTTCRRVIEALADTVYPPTDEPALIGIQSVEVTAKHCKNRIRVYVRNIVQSDSRYDRISKIISTLYDRVSAGVHSDVSYDEAKSLTLQTYLLVGEVLSLGVNSRKIGNSP